MTAPLYDVSYFDYEKGRQSPFLGIPSLASAVVSAAWLQACANAAADKRHYGVVARVWIRLVYEPLFSPLPEGLLGSIVCKVVRIGSKVCVAPDVNPLLANRTGIVTRRSNNGQWRVKFDDGEKPEYDWFRDGMPLEVVSERTSES